jgi:hypothetical protein
MKCSRGLVVAILAVLCLAAVSNAATITLTATSYGKFDSYASHGYTANTLDGLLCSYRYLNVKYDLSSIIAEVQAGKIEITSATLYYKRGYTGDDTAQATITVAQAAVDPVTATSANWASLVTNSGLLQGVNVVLAPEVVTGYANYHNLPYEGGYAGLQSIDITTIVDSWASGAANYGVDIASSLEIESLTDFGQDNALPYLVITYESVPEPVTMGLLVVGGIAALLRRSKA